MKKNIFLLIVLLTLMVPGLSGCLRSASETTSIQPGDDSMTPGPEKIVEHEVVLISLEGKVAGASSELSGLAWLESGNGNILLLLPQYPQRFTGGDDGAIFSLQEEEILAWLDGRNTQPLIPQLVPMYAPGLLDIVQGFEGFESIAVKDDRIYLTIEAKPGADMMGYVISGIIAEDLGEIRLDVNTLAELKPQANLSNMTDEAIVAAGGSLVTLYEANGEKINPNPVAHRFSLDLQPQPDLAFPALEYRVTDATSVDKYGRFWVINYFFPEDTKLKPIPDPLAALYGEGETHQAQEVVERLVEFQFTESGIQMVDQPPVYLKLLPDGTARNWEGLVRLADRGFLLVTDKYPETLLGFIEMALP